MQLRTAYTKGQEPLAIVQPYIILYYIYINMHIHPVCACDHDAYKSKCRPCIYL